MCVTKLFFFNCTSLARHMYKLLLLPSSMAGPMSSYFVGSGGVISRCHDELSMQSIDVSLLLSALFCIVLHRPC
jgi:hypothetical protein